DLCATGRYRPQGRAGSVLHAFPEPPSGQVASQGPLCHPCLDANPDSLPGRVRQVAYVSFVIETVAIGASCVFDPALGWICACMSQVARAGLGRGGPYPDNRGRSDRMSSNKGVVYIGPGKVEVQAIADPKFQSPDGRKIEHGVILKVISTNICGSDQHMVRGRTTAEAGLVLGHEITGAVIEKGSDVEMLEVGDIVSVPFNVACGRCRTCRAQDTGVCLTVNPSRAGGAYGYVDMGGWIGGQAKYVTIPYADFNLLKIPDRDRALAKIRDLTMLS